MKSMRWCSILFFSISMGLLSACFRQEVITIALRVPQMQSDACARLAVQALGRLEAEAILKAAADVPNRTLSVTYNSTRLAVKNIEFALTAAGFDVNDEQATDEARQRLPEGCR